jgi:hypothetical protein
MKTHKFKILGICTLISVLMACSKDKTLAPLPNGSVSFDRAQGNDVIESDLSILEDKLTTLEIMANFNGTPSTDDHYITFAVDTTKIADYKRTYGNNNAKVFPTSSYLFYKPVVKLQAGASKSEAAQLNIGQQTKLTEYTTYVLPIVIRSVDGEIEGANSERVLYYVFKTGKPLVINKAGWTILAFSSQNSTANAPTTLLDANNTTTFWTTQLAQTMPQFVSINFNRDIIFTGVIYYLPTALGYPNNGGYPTSFQIETSMNGTTWVNKGTFTGNISNNMQTVDIGNTTARYLRFTCLSSAVYLNAYNIISIAGISLVP